MKVETHHIDLDKLNDFAHVGVRRAAIFMGLGLNAANRQDFLDYELSKVPQNGGKKRFPVEFVPEALPPDRVAYFKSEFASWIRDCCLCDALEHHALVLDKIHVHALAVLGSLSKLSKEDDPKKLHSKFRHQGLPGKHKILRDKFNIDPAHSDTLDQLYEARNALTHDLGIVVPKRCDASGAFVLKWPKLEFFGIGQETGTKTLLAEMMGRPTTEATEIVVTVEQREIVYKAGDRVEALRDTLEEVLHFMAGWAVPATVAAFAIFLKENGVQEKQS